MELVKPYWYSDRKYSTCKYHRDSLMMLMMTFVFVYGAELEPWVFFRGAEYYFASKPFPWEAVAFACKMMGADLLSVHSSDELNFIRDRMKVKYIFIHLLMYRSKVWTQDVFFFKKLIFYSAGMH